jgi:hypothetical protein
MKDRRLVATLVALATLACAGSARAQDRYIRPYEFNLHAGAFFPDQDRGDDTEVLLGGRFLANMLSGWSFGGSFDWVPRDAIPTGGEDINVNTYLYSAGVEYNFATQSTTRLFLAGGIGAATTKLSDAPAGVDDSDTNLLVPLGIGVKWHDRASDPAWGIRVELRDNLIWVEDGGNTDATNNFEISGGVSFLIGG